MFVVKDLLGGSKPQPIELPYNGDQHTNSVTRRYKGSLAKVVDGDEIDEGVFVTFGGDGTPLENCIGILEEDQPITGNYLMTDGTYPFRYRKITPIILSSIIEAEYRAKNVANGTTSDTGASGNAASATLAAGGTVTQHTMIGGWVYFLTGSNAGYLHYIEANDGSNNYTLATVLVNAVVSGDTFLNIRPPMASVVDFDATYTCIQSEIATASNLNVIMGLSTWISAPGLAKTKLARNTHDGLKIDNARFFHHFTLPSTTTLCNVWVHGIKTS